MAVVMFMVDAMEYFQRISIDEVKSIAHEIMYLGIHGINPNNKGYKVGLIPDKSFSGYHLLAYYYVSWAIAEPKQLELLELPFKSEYGMAKKMFGIFDHHHIDVKLPIFRGFDDVFRAPHSRHTQILAEDILKVPEIELISRSDEAGVHMVMANQGKELFITGPPEYSRGTLNREYKRDFEKGLPIDLPRNYYKNNDPSKEPVLSWRSHANLLFLNWLNYYVYQETPYDLHDIK